MFMIVGLYHVVFYILRRKNASFLYFGCICLLYSVRIPFWRSGSKFITVLFPHFPWEIAHKIDQIGWYLLVPFIIMFISDLYPREGAPKVLRFTQITAFFFSSIILFFPARISYFSFIPYWIFGLVILLFSVWILVRAAGRKREGARLLLGCFLIAIPAAMIEFLRYYFPVLPGNITSVGLLMLALVQSFVLSRQYARALGTAESLSEELEQKNIALSRLDRLKDEFLANTSHELRTPLHGIIGIAESVISGAGGKLSDTAKSNLSLIVSSGRRLTNLVNDILDFSRLKNRDIKLQIRPVRIHALAETVLFVTRPLAAGKEIGLVNAVPHTVPPVSGDENRLQQILYNLIGNAIKFTRKGEIRISASPKDSFLEIAVSDTGIGIPKDRINDIFQSFEQTDASDTREYGGTGLGLSITRQLVELHGGRIRAESEPGEGSTFRFTIPVSLHEPEADPESQVSGVVKTPVLSPPQAFVHEIPPETKTDTQTDGPLFPERDVRILVVDDDPVNLRVVSNFLSSPEVSISTCTNGMEALERIQQEGCPDLILLDIMMPQMSGYEVCRKLRTSYSSSELPIIMLTAKNQVTDLIFGFESGASDYLVKPFTGDELVARVRTHLKLKSAYRVLRENLSLRTELEQRKQTIQDLKILHHRFAGILDRVKDAVLAVNESDEVSFCNRSCTRLLGYEAEDIIGLPITGFLHGDVIKHIVSLKSGVEQNGIQTETPDVLHGIEFRCKDKDTLILDVRLAGLDLEDDRLYLLILRESSTPDKGFTPESVPAVKVVEALNRNRSRLQSLEESLDNLANMAPREDLRILNELKVVDTALEELGRSLTKDKNPEDKRWLAHQVMTLSLEYWTESTGAAKSEIARQSKLWYIYTNQDGWERTQTLDKYLDPAVFPVRPRWKKVVSTADFVLSTCKTPSPTRDRLETALEKFRLFV